MLFLIQFRPFWAIWVASPGPMQFLVQLGLFWTILGPPRGPDHFWSNLVRFGPFWTDILTQHIGLHVGQSLTDMYTDLNPNIGLHVVRCGPAPAPDLYTRHIGLHVDRSLTDM